MTKVQLLEGPLYLHLSLFGPAVTKAEGTIGQEIVIFWIFAIKLYVFYF